MHDGNEALRELLAKQAITEVIYRYAAVDGPSRP